MADSLPAKTVFWRDLTPFGLADPVHDFLKTSL
jgi:hypothetical protein